jgi:phospholipase C
MSGCGGASQPPITIDPPPKRINTVFIIAMENHNWTGDTESIKGNASAPYINGTIVPLSSYAANYFNPPHIHPSLPNYVWLEAGTNFDILGDNAPLAHRQSTHEHLVALLQAQNISWKAYDERADGIVCPLQNAHLPFVVFDDVTNDNDPNSPNCIQHIRPFAELAGDLAAGTVPRYNFIVPDLCHAMHTLCDGPDRIAQGDQWLSTVVPAILNSAAYKNNGVLFILWDEAATGDGPIPFFVLSPLAKGNGYSNTIYYDHGSTLRTLEQIFGVTPLLGDAANQQAVSDLFVSGISAFSNQP